MDAARRTATSLLAAVPTAASSVLNALPSVSLSFSSSASASSTSKIMSFSASLQPAASKRSSKAPPKWSRHMSIAVPLYRVALSQTSHSIKRTRSILKILPTPAPENTRIEPVKLCRRSDVHLIGMTEEDRSGHVDAEWVTHVPKKMREEGCESFTGVDPDPMSNKVILYFHGGGYFMGSPANHRDMTSKLAELTGARVLSVAYRLAPEHTFPSPLHDALSAYLALVDPQDPSAPVYSPEQIVFGGDSAGGGLAIALSLWLRDHGHHAAASQPALLGTPATRPATTPAWRQPRGILALAPWLDLTHSQPSFHLATDDYLPARLTDPCLAASGHAYTRSEPDNRNPYVSPLFSTDGGARPRLAPTLVQVGDRERLRDEGLALAAERFARSPVRVECYDDMVHVFQAFGDGVGRMALARAAAFVRGLFAADGPLAPGFYGVSVEGVEREMGRRGAVDLLEAGRAELAALRRAQKMARPFNLFVVERRELPFYRAM